MKLLPDYHLHSSFSGDCETELLSIIDKAKSLGMESLCLTDHNDLDFPETPDGVRFDLDIDTYLKTLTELRDSLSGIDLRIGVEQGVMPETIDILNTYSSEHPGLDFIICSTHTLKGYDPYYPQVFEAYPEEDVYRMYFEDILNTVNNFRDYNVYGHIDYIFRYGPTKGENFSIIKYYDIFKAIFTKIIENGKGIELNTGSLYRELTYIHPRLDILRVYKELGGEIITVGSDSHDTEHIGYGFDRARDLLLSEGFKYYTEFKNMNPEFKDLN